MFSLRKFQGSGVECFLKPALLICLLAAGVSTANAGQLVRGDHLNVQLVAASDKVAPGGDIVVGLKQMPARGWHTYWLNPGDTGLATQITWSLPANVTAGPVQWPTPAKFAYAGVTTYGYEGDSTLLIRLHNASALKAGATLPIKAHVETLVCEKLCVPESFDVSLDLKIAAAAPSGNGTLTMALAAIPQPVNITATVARKNGFVEMGFVRPDGALGWRFRKPDGVYAFLEGQDIVAPSAPQKLEIGDKGFSLRVKAGDGKLVGDISAVLRFADGSAWRVRLTPAPLPPGTFGSSVARTAPAVMPVGGLILAMALAFAGGLILNLMPCVFPVLSIKLLALTRAGYDKKRARSEAMLYGVGAILSFLVLAGVLNLASDFGASLGWGFQLQSPFVTGFLSLLLLLVALNMSGFFEVGASLQSLAGDRLSSLQDRPRLSAFMTGVLAVVIAAPCSAPFMATAIGVALAQGGLISLAIFAALGTGFALPFVALAFAITVMPSLARRMPKPGIWMDRLRKWLALPMYAAAAWMIWVFAQQVNELGFILLVAAIALIGLGAMTARLPLGVKRAFLGLGIMLSLAAAGQQQGAENAAATSEVPGRVAFSLPKIAALQAQNKPILVDMTAAWCLTCKVNEKMVLSDSGVQQAFKTSGTTYMVGDWTHEDADISGYLRRFGRSGVPLYVYYGAHDAAPVVLPQILHKSDLIKLLTQKS